MIEIKKYIVSIMKTNCYLIKDPISKNGIIIDPGYQSKELNDDIKECNKIQYILLTHGHFDHILAANSYRTLTNAKIVIGYKEKEFTKNNDLNISGRFKRTHLEGFDADIFVNDNDKLKFIDKDIRIIDTPGHTKGGVCYIIEKFIFTGDTIMKGDIGRCDLPTGNEDQLKFSIKKILKEKGDYIVCPGHGDQTTLKDEKKNIGFK